LVIILGAGVAGADPTEVCTTSGPLVCLSVSDTPETVPPSAAGSPRYISYHVVVSNRASNAVTHLTLAASLPAGSSLVSATPGLGSCTADTGTPACTLGKLASGAAVTVDVVITAPGAEGTALATFTASFDEGFNDNPPPDPKQDNVSVTEATIVAATSGRASSFVPEGASVELSTDPTGTGVATLGDALLADAMITSAPTALTASIEEVAGPLKCPKGVVCRRGDWVQATIPGTFDPPLSFTLRWDKSLIPRALSAKKFALLLTECLNGCPLQIVSSRCPSATPPQSALPCLSNVQSELDGDWVATLFNNHNGFMH
jgi:Domain of unknown function DUF11